MLLFLEGEDPGMLGVYPSSTLPKEVDVRYSEHVWRCEKRLQSERFIFDNMFCPRNGSRPTSPGVCCTILLRKYVCLVFFSRVLSRVLSQYILFAMVVTYRFLFFVLRLVCSFSFSFLFLCSSQDRLSCDSELVIG